MFTEKQNLQSDDIILLLLVRFLTNKRIISSAFQTPSEVNAKDILFSLVDYCIEKKIFSMEDYQKKILFMKSNDFIGKGVDTMLDLLTEKGLCTGRKEFYSYIKDISKKP